MYVLIAKGKFPHQVQKTDATVGWVEAEIEGWIQEREALRPGRSAERGAEVAPRPPAKPTSPSGVFWRGRKARRPPATCRP